MSQSSSERNVASASASLADVGGRGFLISSVIGRFPAATVQLGMLLVMAASGNGFASSGLTVAAIGLGGALGAPLIGAMTDRFGPILVVTAALIGQVGSLGVYLYGLTNAWPVVSLLVVSAVVGFCNPQIGAIARSRWAKLARRPGASPTLIQRALGYESAVDEGSFVAGPLLASILVTAFGPIGALWAMIVFIAAGEGLFIADCLRRRDEWRPEPRTTSLNVLPSASIPPQIAIPVLAAVCIGTVFGATQTALTASLSEIGRSSWAGFIYCFMGIGSVVSSFVAGRLPTSVQHHSRLVIGGSIAATAILGLSFSGSITLSVIFCILAGLGIGTSLVSAYSLVEIIAPSQRLATLMTWVATGTVVGVSLGSVLAGIIADQGWLFWSFSTGMWAQLLIVVLGIVTAQLQTHFSRSRAVLESR